MYFFWGQSDICKVKCVKHQYTYTYSHESFQYMAGGIVRGGLVEGGSSDWKLCFEKKVKNTFFCFLYGWKV